MRWPEIKSFLEEGKLKKNFQRLKIIILAIGVCPFIYVAIGFILAKNRFAGTANPASNHILILLYFISGVMALLGLMLPLKMVARGSLSSMSETEKQGPLDKEKLGLYLAAFTRATILRAAIFESIGIYGFVGFIMAQDMIILLALNFFAFLFIMLHFPGQERFINFIDHLDKA